MTKVTLNKVISTDPRCFVSLVGPSGSGKTQLVFEMLTLSSMFQPGFDHIVYFYQHHQPLYSAMQDALGTTITFIQGVDWAFVDNLPTSSNEYHHKSTSSTNQQEAQCFYPTTKTPRFLLVFDDVCENISNSKEFQDLATSGRHRNLHVFFIKHNLFHQSKFSRTIDLNTTHIILFKSPRDQDQIRYLGRQLGNRKLLIESYKDATKKPYGHLLIDLDPRCNEFLRYSSNVTGETIFYAPKPKSRKLTKSEKLPQENNIVVIEIEDEHSKHIYAGAFRRVQPEIEKTVFT